MYAWMEAQRNLNRALLSWPDVRGAYAAVLGLPGGEGLLRALLPPIAPPGFDIAAVRVGEQDEPVVETVVVQLPFCQLRRFTRSPAPAPACAHGASEVASVLLCAPLAGHHAVILRQAVQTCLQMGDVYVTDWCNPRDVPASAGVFGLDDNVLTLARFLRQLTPHGLHVLAICQACAPTLAAVALHAAGGGTAPLSVTLVGGPIDTRLHPTTIGYFAASHTVETLRATLIDVVPPPYAGAGRRVLPGYLQHLGLMAANPQRQIELEACYRNLGMAGDEKGAADALHALAEYAAVMDLDETFFLQTVQRLFKEHQLAEGRWRIAGQIVALDAIADTALCTVEGTCDRITGAGQTHAAHVLCSRVPEARRLRLTIAGCDHYGLFTGPHWQHDVYPQLAALWQSARADRAAPPADVSQRTA